MRHVGDLLMRLGAALGAAVGLGTLFGIGLHGLSWLVMVGLVKLTLAGALGLIAGGAVLRRLALRAEQRERQLPPSSTERNRGR
jgi:hypothetical protein